MNRLCHVLFAVVLLANPGRAAVEHAMPAAADFGFLSWDAAPPYFHGQVENTNVPRILWIETGRYALAVDTRTLSLPHAGPLRQTRPAALTSDRREASRLPAGRIQLRLAMGGEVYECVGLRDAGKDQWAYPVRFAQTGRWLQQVDFDGLVWRTRNGKELAADAHLEINGWPDRVTFFAEVKPRAAVAGANLSLDVTVPGMTSLSDATTNALSAVIHLLTAGAHEDNGPPPEVAAAALDQSAPVIARRAEWDAWEVKIEGRAWSNPTGTYYPAEHLDRVDHWPVQLRNDSDNERTVRLVFTRTRNMPITGLTPMWLDTNGLPIGLPVQVSKNWHIDSARPRLRHEGPWLRASTVVRLPPRSERRLQFALCYAKWGGLFAASHAQLSLIGWGHNQFWDEAAMGSFGESICFEPGRVQRRCFITDVRPFLVTHKPETKPWEWTANAGGGDFLVCFDAAKHYVPFARTRTDYRSPGPCLTRTTYAETGADGAIAARITVSLARGQDHLRVFQHLRYDVRRDFQFSRLAFAQLGADFYNSAHPQKLAVGNAGGLAEEWSPGQGSRGYARRGIPLSGEQPWFSAHDEQLDGSKGEGGATRGVIIRTWSARLGGVGATPPYLAIYRTEDGPKHFRNALELAPPPALTALKAGDFVEADLEWCVFPRRAEDYYGPDDVFRAALRASANTWRPVHREAASNTLHVIVTRGTRESSTLPRIRVDATQRAEVRFESGLGHLPITFTGLRQPDGFVLAHRFNDDLRLPPAGAPGKDFWQADYDETTGEWSLTCNVPAAQATNGLVFGPGNR